jgi:4-hydroxybenzoate polyprenyltransferase
MLGLARTRTILSDVADPTVRLPAAVRLVHPFPIAVVVVTSAVLAAVLTHGPPPLLLWIRIVATVAASQIGVGALNDFADRHADRLHQPEKPIPSGEIRPHHALLLALAAVFVTLVLAASFGVVSFAITCIAVGGGIAYDLGLKGTVWSIACYLVGLLGLFAWLQAVTDTWSEALLLVYPGGACIIAAAHLANAAPDIEGDAERGLAPLSVRLGPAGTVFAIYALFVIVWLPCLAIAVLVHSASAAFVALLSLGLAAIAVRTSRRMGASRRGRIILFRLITPALGLVALAGLIGIQALGH